jgi:hypothetical protein
LSTNNKTTPDIHRKRTGTRRLSKKTQQQIDWRRNKLSDYLVMGKSLMETSRIMNIPYDTLYKDQRFLAEQARDNMRNHITELPFNIKQATDGLNKLISTLYDIQDLEIIRNQGRKTSDHVRVMAIGLIKDCYKEKMEILTSQAAVNHALDFIDKTNNRIKQEFNQDMQQVIEQDRAESAAIKDTVENYSEIQSSYSTTGSTHHTQGCSSASSEQEQDQEEEEFMEQEDFEDEDEEEEGPELEGQ